MSNQKETQFVDLNEVNIKSDNSAYVVSQPAPLNNSSQKGNKNPNSDGCFRSCMDSLLCCTLCLSCLNNCMICMNLCSN